MALVCTWQCCTPDTTPYAPMGVMFKEWLRLDYKYSYRERLSVSDHLSRWGQHPVQAASAQRKSKLVDPSDHPGFKGIAAVTLSTISANP